MRPDDFDSTVSSGNFVKDFSLQASASTPTTF